MSDNIIKAVAFDVDGTIVDSSIWETLHTRFGFSPDEDARLFQQWTEGAISFREWMERVDVIYRKAEPQPVQAEVDAILLNFEFVPGTKEVIATLRERYPLALISSGFMDYVDPVAHALSISHAYSFMYLAYDEGGVYDGMRFRSPGTELQAKVDALKDFGAKVGAKPHEIAFVGDSLNDLAAFEYTGKGILIGESYGAMRVAAWKRINSLPELLRIL